VVNYKYTEFASSLFQSRKEVSDMNAQQETIRQPVLFHGTTADRIAEVGFGLAVLSGLAAAISGPGTRLGFWYFMTGFSLLRVAAIGGGIAAILSVIGGVMARHEHKSSIFYAAAAGILIGLIAFGIPTSWAYKAGKMPLIHDITTDMENPPQFKAIMPLRQDAQNPATYGGQEIAVKQASAYPDIRPLILPVSKQAAFDTALLTAKNMGWQIVDSNRQEGRIEAIATTLWFGFKDDIVVRVSDAENGSSRVDIRSTSRVGLSDIGTNAARVRTYLRKLGGAGVSVSANANSGGDIAY
jgi:uncharacterized protein (DUF1499 family)